MIAKILSVGIKKKKEVAVNLHKAAFGYIRTHNHFDVLKVVVGFVNLLNKHMLPLL